MDHLRAGDGQTATCGHGDGRLRAGCSAGSSGPWMTAASSWRSGSASTVASIVLPAVEDLSRGNGPPSCRRWSDGHVRPRRRPSEGGILGGILRPMDDGSVVQENGIRVGGVQEIGIQHGRRCPIRTRSLAAGGVGRSGFLGSFPQGFRLGRGRDSFTFCK